MARKKQTTLVLFPEILSVTRKLSDEQFGVLMRAAFAYRLNGEIYSGNDVAVDVAFQFVSNQIDRYMENCAINARNASSTNPEDSEMQRNAAEYSQNTPPIRSYPYPYPIRSDKREADKPPTHPSDNRISYGKYGWVKLTNEEYSCLINELGEQESHRCITYIDESAQMTGNKNKWSDWDLVIRKCHAQGWGISSTTNTRVQSRDDSLDEIF